MYEYRIIRNDRWWIIYRKKEMGKLLLLQYLNSYNLWTPNKWSAKTFYKKEDAVDALVIMKQKDNKKSD